MDGVVALATTAKIANASAASVRIWPSKISGSFDPSLKRRDKHSIGAAAAKIIKTGPRLREVDHTRENFGRGPQSCAAAIPSGPAAASDVRANVTRARAR